MPRKKQELAETMLPTEGQSFMENAEEPDFHDTPQLGSPPEPQDNLLSSSVFDNEELGPSPEDDFDYTESPLDETITPETLDFAEPRDNPDEKKAHSQAKRTTSDRSTKKSILTISAGDEVETPQSLEETAWHGIRNAYHTHRILTGVLIGMEEIETGKSIAIINYNNFRVVIPVSELLIPHTGEESYGVVLKNRILSKMVGAEIDFVIKGIETKSRSIVASRKEAMLRKRQIFYFNKDRQGNSRINEKDILQARIISVEGKSLWVEAFGVECKIRARDLSYGWLGDVQDHHSVGELILIRVQSIHRESVNTLSIEADVKSVSGEQDTTALTKCRTQGKYAGVVTDVYNGVVFIRLHIGVNAIAHSCYDERMPIRKDEVSLIVTRLDTERNVAVGIINRIMRRKL